MSPMFRERAELSNVADERRFRLSRIHSVESRLDSLDRLVLLRAASDAAAMQTDDYDGPLGSRYRSALRANPVPAFSNSRGFDDDVEMARDVWTAARPAPPAVPGILEPSSTTDSRRDIESNLRSTSSEIDEIESRVRSFESTVEQAED